MDKIISDIRNEYKRQELLEKDVHKNPLLQFKKWLDEAIEAKMPEPTAMNFCTVSDEGKPSARIVLLKGISDVGLSFYTNYNSKKGLELQNNPHAAITFFWAELERQVRIEGKVKRVDNKTSEEYFHSRPKGSQIGAYVSPQSEEISREKLQELQVEAEKKFETKEVPKPEHWGGYELEPDYFEFWQGRPSRLHDRIVFEKKANNWIIKRIAP